MADTIDQDEVLGSTPDALREQALRRVKKRRDFHAHLFVYLAINAVVWVIWALSSPGEDSWHPWPLWLTLAWGLGLVFNAWDVYARRPITEQDVQREVERLTHR